MGNPFRHLLRVAKQIISPMPWTSLCDLSELTEGKGKYIEIGGYQLAVYLHEGKVYAMDNRCPHAGANLAGGWILEGCVVCPEHGWPFRLENGQLRDGPNVKVDTYPVRLVDREGLPPLIEARLPASAEE